MAAKEDCRKTLGRNTARIQNDYLNGLIDITKAKSLYNSELSDYVICSGDGSTTSIPNPFEQPKILNFIFITPFIIRSQSGRMTFFKVNDVVQGEKLANGDIKVMVNGESIPIPQSYLVETNLDVTPNTYTESISIIEKQDSRNTGVTIAKWVVGIVIFLLFIKLLKII